MKSSKIVIFLYNRFFDPVVQSNFWLFIAHTLSDKKHQFHVVSYENPNHPLTPIEQYKLSTWKEMGLGWTPLRWHSGTRLTSKLYDVLQGFFVLLRLRLSGFRFVMAFASVSGSFSYFYSKLLKYNLYIHSYEPHSEYMLDNGKWKAKSLQYKILNYLEYKSAHEAKIIVSATNFMRKRLMNEWRVKSTFYKIPSVIDEIKFRFNEQDRIDVRSKLNITQDLWVLYYPGKFGDLYYYEETVWMFRWLYELNARFHFLIVTPQNPTEIFQIFDAVGVPKNAFTITQSSYDNIHQYASAADFGIIAVPPGPSKKFISNIKVGEYLCAGLPYLITKGVSEDYLIASEKEVGVVVNDFDKSSILKAYPQICSYLESDKKRLRNHCREIGVGYRGFENLSKVFDKALIDFTAS